jgi:hypothetical protein
MPDTATPDRSKMPRRIAIILALFWAALWLVFGVASGFLEPGPHDIRRFAETLPGLVFLVTTLIAWRWPLVGGIVLLGMGLLILVAYPVLMHARLQWSTIIITDAFLALPPLVAGLLFLLAARRRA